MLLPFAPMMRLATLNLSWLTLGHETLGLGPGVLNRVGATSLSIPMKNRQVYLTERFRQEPIYILLPLRDYGWSSSAQQAQGNPYPMPKYH